MKRSVGMKRAKALVKAASNSVGRTNGHDTKKHAVLSNVTHHHPKLHIDVITRDELSEYKVKNYEKRRYLKINKVY